MIYITPYNVTGAYVNEYINELVSIYSSEETDEQYYNLFDDLEYQYTTNRVDNFCHTVHKLSTKEYGKDKEMYPIRNFFKCYCGKEIPPHNRYNLHINSIDYVCKCNRKITLEQININLFKFKNPILKIGGYEFKLEINLSTWSDLCNSIIMQLKERRIDIRYVKSLLKSMIKNFVLSSSSIDLIKAMYKQLEFCKKIRNFKLNIKSSIDKYNKFMFLIKYSNKMLVPTIEIDIIWHSHIKQYDKYVQYCENICNKIIHHNDKIDKNNLKTAFAYTCIKWSKMYNETYSQNKPKYGDYAPGLNYYSPYRLYKWYKYSRLSLIDTNMSDLNCGAGCGDDCNDIDCGGDCGGDCGCDGGCGNCGGDGGCGGCGGD